MLSREENERLTQVSAGTPMGDLMRRYWHPVGAISEFDGAAAKQVRILGERSCALPRHEQRLRLWSVHAALAG